MCSRETRGPPASCNIGALSPVCTAGLWARLLSTRSILTANQAERLGASDDEQDPNAWEEMVVRLCCFASLYPARLSPSHGQGDGNPRHSGASEAAQPLTGFE